MPHRCPWYIGYFLINPLRKLTQSPAKLLAPHVRPGYVVLEPGPGMGFFTLELARRVGEAGKVHAVDIEPRMLAQLKRRAGEAGLGDRIHTRLASETGFGLDDLAGQVDFVLAFAVVHEMASADAFFAEMARAMKPGARMLLAEPRGHVCEAAFAAECEAAATVGLTVVEPLAIASSRAALLEKA